MGFVRWGLATSVVVVLASCLQSLVPCGDLYCPAGKECYAPTATCYGPDQIAACDGLPDHSPCTIADLAGFCLDGICQPPRCGDGVTQQTIGEQCDDGDAANSDDPDAHCRTNCRLANCGDGIVDPGRGEVCDDGGATGVDDTCAADCGSTLTCGNGLIDLGEECDDANSTAHDGCSGCRLEQLVDSQLIATSPRSRTGGVMTYDAARQRTVVYGGVSPTGGNRSDTWEWDGGRWREIKTLTTPVGRSAAAAVYDAARMRVMMFGGALDTGAPQDDLWEYDGANWKLHTGGLRPPARSSHAMAYDAKRKRVIVFGGHGVAGTLGDTWEWDGTTWTNVTPADPMQSPPPLESVQMVYDPIHSETVLFGGTSMATGPVQNTWIWNGTAWVDRTPVAATNPPPRYQHMMVFDVVNQDVLLVYGRNTTTIIRDYWKWDGTAWTLLPSMGILPYTLPGMLSYDAAHRQLVYLYNTIVRVRSAATFLNPPLLSTPAARTHAAIAFDARRGKVVLYGGGMASGAGYDPAQIVPNETWEWNGSVWATPGLPASTNPGPRRGAGMAYSLRDGIVLEGGNTNELWKWNGQAWSQLAAAPPAMVDRWAGGMVYDRERDRVIVANGYFAQDQWEWNGGWTQTQPPDAAGYRWNFAMGYDPIRKRTLVTGGQTSTAMSFEYDGTSWVSVPSSTSFGRGCVMAYDQGRKVLDWFVDPDDVGMEMWQYDGAWTQLQPIPSLPPLYKPAVVYDPVRSELLMFGGRSGATYLNTTRVLYYQPNAAPEACTSAAIDYDRDGLAGCADPDCAARCKPLCLGASCPMNAPTCGDGICDPLEDCLLCPHDCTAGCPLDDCGDFRCSGTETAATCPGDCGS